MPCMLCERGSAPGLQSVLHACWFPPVSLPSFKSTTFCRVLSADCRHHRPPHVWAPCHTSSWTPFPHHQPTPPRPARPRPAKSAFAAPPPAVQSCASQLPAQPPSAPPITLGVKPRLYHMASGLPSSLSLPICAPAPVHHPRRLASFRPAPGPRTQVSQHFSRATAHISSPWALHLPPPTCRTRGAPAVTGWPSVFTNPEPHRSRSTCQGAGLCVRGGREGGSGNHKRTWGRNMQTNPKKLCEASSCRPAGSLDRDRQLCSGALGVWQHLG